MRYKCHKSKRVILEAGDCRGPNFPFAGMGNTSKPQNLKNLKTSKPLLPVFSNLDFERSERRCNCMDMRLVMINFELNPTSGNISLLLTLRASPTLQTVASMASIT